MKKLSSLLTFFRVLVVLALICGPLVYAVHHQKDRRNFRVVRKGVLYRSGQMTIPQLDRTLKDHGIKTVISLRYARDGEELPPDVEEQIYCEKQGIRYERVRPLRWLKVNGKAEADKSVAQFVKILEREKKQGRPVLVHCLAGIHRSGAYCAIYRMEFEGWSNADAIAEMKATGYDNLDNEMDILGYLSTYQPGKVSAE